MIGKPSAGKLHAGFDEGGAGRLFMDNPKRARSWKRRIQPRVGLKMVEPALYSTLIRLIENLLFNVKENIQIFGDIVADSVRLYCYLVKWKV